MAKPKESTMIPATFDEAAFRGQPDRARALNRGGKLERTGLRNGSILFLVSIFLMLASLLGCANQMVGWPLPDNLPPTVSSTTPANDATGVTLNTSLTATFSEPMDPATIGSSTFVVEQGSMAVPGTVMYVGVTALFMPDTVLQSDTLYTATIGSQVKDLAGNEMANDHVWSFKTGEYLDTTAPEVSSTWPVNDATDVALNAPVAATFTEVMNPTTITTSTFIVRDGTTTVPGTVMYSGVTAIFSPMDGFLADTTYTATIESGVTDLAGNMMLANYVWSFKTGEFLDTTAPEVTSTWPADDATSVALNAPVAATFTEVMNPTTITTTSFIVRDGTTLVPGTVMYSGVTAIFSPMDSFLEDTDYTATIQSSVADLAGNTMLANYVWNFRTGNIVDDIPPMVIATNPVDSATYVSLDSAIIGVLSEAMDSATLSTSSFMLAAGTTPVAGTVNYVGVIATFTPTTILAPETTYVATITTDATDLAGNALAADYTWSFQTGETPDITNPYVVSTTPADEETEVVLETNVSATFSEVMHPLTVNTSTFILQTGMTSITGTVSQSGLTVTFDPASDLSPGTEYTATITSAATDLAGNSLAADYVWTFTTGAPTDTIQPRVTYTIPADDATGVTLDGNIVAVFSEQMDPATITAASFSVQQLDTTIVGSVIYTGVTAVFTPVFPLSPLTTYSATISTMAQDLEGNSLERNYVWNFKTGNTPDTTHPWVVSTVPEDEEVSVALDTNVSATFNEAMDPLTINSATFVLMDGIIEIDGDVTLTGDTALMVMASDLDHDTEYMAILTVEVADLAGNTLEEEYSWTFTTGIFLDLNPPTVISTTPEDLATNVALDTTVNATFSEDMDPLSITTATFTLMGPGLSEVVGTVLYDDLSRIGTFTPESELLPASSYTATVSSLVTDLSGTPMEDDYVWTFSTGKVSTGMLPVDLGSLSTFVAVAGAGLTNSNSSGITVLNGDVGLYPTATCLGDGAPCTATNPVINGTLYAADPEGVAAQAKVDLIAAYVDAMSRPPGTTVNDISGLVLPPGVYTSGSTMSIAVGGTVTLDGEGDGNAVWIFQIGSSLTVNNNAQVLLINGAKAKNVFWAAFASSTLGTEVDFQGSVLAGASNSVGTDSTVDGRLLCTTGQITLLSNTITLPAL